MWSPRAAASPTSSARSRSRSKPAKSSSSPMAIRMSCRAVPACAPIPSRRTRSTLPPPANCRSSSTTAASGPASAKLVCGFLACDAQPFNPLLDNLPPVIKAGDPQDSDAGWLGQFIRLAMSESADKRAGGESVLAKLSELMFIEVVRRHLETLPPEQAGWLAGLRDPFVGKALSLMHGAPAHNWTIEELAKEVGAVALGAGRAFHRPRRHSADALSRQMADADRFGASERRQRQCRDRRRRNRLRIRGGLQPRLQEDGGRAALGLASPPRA